MNDIAPTSENMHIVRPVENCFICEVLPEDRADEVPMFWVFSGAGEFLAVCSSMALAQAYIRGLKKRALAKMSAHAVATRAAAELAAKQELEFRGWKRDYVRAKFEAARIAYAKKVPRRLSAPYSPGGPK